MFPMQFDQFGNQLRDTTRSDLESDVLSPCPSSSLRSEAKTLTSTIIQQPAYDSRAGSAPRFLEDYTFPMKRENVAGDSDEHLGKSEVTENAGKMKERQRKEQETKCKPFSENNSVKMPPALQKESKNNKGPASVNTVSFNANRLDRNFSHQRFCNNSVNKRLPFLMLGKKERKELPKKESEKSPVNNLIKDNGGVKTQELSTPPTKLTRVATAKPDQENTPEYETYKTTDFITQYDTPNNNLHKRPSPIERKRVNNVNIDDRTLHDATLILEARSLDNNVRSEKKPTTPVRLTHGGANQGHHNETLNSNRKNVTNSDNILQSLRRQVENEKTSLKGETSKLNEGCKESIVNITLLSFGIQNKTSASILDPGLLVKNGKRIVLSEDALRPEIDRLLSHLTEYMVHQQEGDGVGRGLSPEHEENHALQSNKKISEKDEKDLPSTNHNQDLQVYRVEASHPRSKPSCSCSEMSKDSGCSSTSLSESEGSDSSVMRSRRLPQIHHGHSPRRRGTVRRESFHSDSKEIGVVDYEHEPPKSRATSDSRRRRGRHDAVKERERFKNEPTSYPVEAVCEEDDRIKRSERRRYSLRSSERRANETRAPDGYKSIRANFELKSSRGQGYRKYSEDKEDGKYDSRSSKRRSRKQEAPERDAADGIPSRRPDTSPRCEKVYERSGRGGRKRSTSAPQYERRHGGTNRHRDSSSDEETSPSVEEVTIKRYQSGRQSARGNAEERRSQRNPYQRQNERRLVERRASPDGSERFKVATRHAVKVSGRRLGVSEERRSSESIRHQRKASNKHGRTSVDVRESPEARSDRDRYRRAHNTSSIEQKEIGRHTENRRSPMRRARSVTTFEPDDLESEDSADDSRPRRISHHGKSVQYSRSNSFECDVAERTRRKYSADQREPRQEGHSRDSRRDRRRSAHFEDEVDNAPASQRWSIDSTSEEISRGRLESRRNSAYPESLDRKERKGEASERRPTFDSQPRNDDIQSPRIAEETRRRASEQSNSPEMFSADKSTKPTGLGQNSMETIPPVKKASKTRQMLENAYRFGKHPIQAIKTRRWAARSAKPDSTGKNGDKDKTGSSIAVENYRAISVQTSPVYSSTHSRKVRGSSHRTSLRRGETLRLPSRHVIVNRGVLDSAPSRYGSYTRTTMDARRTMICGEDDGVIDIRDKKLKQCFCGQTGKKNANAIDGFELLCACDANQCYCLPKNKPDARTSAPKQQYPIESHGSRREYGPSTPQRPCERRKGDDADAVILVRSGKYLEVDVSDDKRGRRSCGSRARDGSAPHRECGRYADSGGYRHHRRRDSLGSNSSDLAAYRQGSSNSMIGFERDRGMVDKRYNIGPSKRGADSAGRHGGKGGDRDLDDKYAKALGRDGRSKSGRGGEDDDARNSRRGKDGKSRSGKEGDNDPRNSRGGRGGKSGSGMDGGEDYMKVKGKGGEYDPRNSRGGKGGKSGSGMDGDDDLKTKDGRDGKSRKGRGGVDDPRNSRGGKGGKSGSGVDSDDEDAMKNVKEGKDGKSKGGKGGDDPKNKKGMQSKSGSEKSGSDLETDTKGKRGKKPDKSDKENQADLKAAEKSKVDSGTGPDAAKDKKTKLRKETPEQRAKRVRRERDHQEGGIYHGLVLRSSEDDPSTVIQKEYRS